MFEGHDTTASAMTWAIFLIGKFPQVQRNIHEELDYVFGDDVTRDVTMDDVRKMTYLEQVCFLIVLFIYYKLPLIYCNNTFNNSQ